MQSGGPPPPNAGAGPKLVPPRRTLRRGGARTSFSVVAVEIKMLAACLPRSTLSGKISGRVRVAQRQPVVCRTGSSAIAGPDKKHAFVNTGAAFRAPRVNRGQSRRSSTSSSIACASLPTRTKCTHGRAAWSGNMNCCWHPISTITGVDVDKFARPCSPRNGGVSWI